MALPPLLTRPCYCGTNRDEHGMCPHCDKPQNPDHRKAPGGCDACARIDRRCTSCGLIYPDSTAAQVCERNDRAQEIRRRP